MQNEDKEQFTRFLTGLLESHARTASSATFRGYWIALSDLTLEDVVNGITKSLRESDRMPSPAELRKLCGAMGVEDRAVMAWECVRKSFGLGPYRAVCFDDPCINGAIRNLGGWPRMFDNLVTPDKEHWLRHNFIKTYESFCRTEVDGDCCDYLPGLAPVGSFKLLRKGKEVEHVNGIKMIRTGLPLLPGRTNPVPRIPAFNVEETVAGYIAPQQDDTLSIGAILPKLSTNDYTTESEDTSGQEEIIDE